VLATDSDNPNMIPAPNDQPHKLARPVPSAVATMICVNAPGNATRRTAMRSRMEKWVPTPHISRITPISASCGARCASATNPGVNGPTTIPAKRYPTNGGKRSRTASNPPTNAKARLTAMVAISGASWVVTAANTQINRTSPLEMRDLRCEQPERLARRMTQP